MSEKELLYIQKPLKVTEKQAFVDASGEELRVLLAVIEDESTAGDIELLARTCKISKSRARAALVFWQEEGVILSAKGAPTITEEFEERLLKGEIREESSKAVAKSIRDSALVDMINECATIMKRTSFNTREIKDLTALHEQYTLSEEYIVMLAAHLAELGSITVTKLVNRAIQLSEREIDTPPALERYIIEKTGDNEVERSFRAIFGIYNRALSRTEKEAFRKWSKDYGYYTEIVCEAYDIAASSVTRGYVNYADKLLTRWYETGCRTLSDCRKRYEEDLAEKKAKKAESKSKKAIASKERFGNFDVEDAFQRALDRSFGKKGDK